MKILIAMVALFAMVGCGANYFSAKTSVHVMVAPDGTCQADYTSDKEQQGLEASVCGGTVKVDKSGTLESVVSATLQNSMMMQQLIQQLSTLIPAAAKTGALAGS